jgi:hypothetical protein
MVSVLKLIFVLFLLLLGLVEFLSIDVLFRGILELLCLIVLEGKVDLLLALGVILSIIGFLLFFRFRLLVLLQSSIVDWHAEGVCHAVIIQVRLFWLD